MAKPAKKPAAPAVPDADALIVYDCEQGSEEWFAARRGIPTASEFKTIMADSEDRKGRTTLLRKLAGEIITEQPAENYTNSAMDRGKAMEEEIRRWYARSQLADLHQVGFVYDPALDAGWSPDALVGDDGAVELKSAAPHVLIEILERGTFPTQHRAQCHGGLLVGRRRWTDLVIYAHPNMPKYVAHIERDDIYCRQISDAVEVFNYDLKTLVAKIRAMGT